MNDSESFHLTNLFDWTGGIRDPRSNPLAWPPDCLAAGENVDVASGGLITRGGSELVGTLPAPPGGQEWREIRRLYQARFPIVEKSYLIAQAQDSSGDNRLYACADDLPVVPGSASWQEIIHLGPQAAAVSMATVGDRAVITEGTAGPPLVFSGCMDASGSDWATPRVVLVTFNSGVDWHDISAPVCDRDPSTVADIGGLASDSGRLAVCLDLASAAAFRFELESLNSLSGTTIVEGYSNGWTSGSGWVDGTEGLTQDGVIAYAGSVFTASHHVENGIPGFWYMFRWSSGTSSDVRLRRLVFQAPCQPLQIIAAPYPQGPAGFIYWDESDKTARDFTAEVSDGSGATYARLNDGAVDNPSGIGSSDAIYLGGSSVFPEADLIPHNDYNNRNSATLSGSYWNGSQWAPLSGFSDGTQEPAGKTFGKKGRIRWTIPADWKQNRPVSSLFPQGYWIRLKVSSNLTARTYISGVGIWPTPDPLKKHQLVLTVGERLMLCGPSHDPDCAEISRRCEPQGFAGEDAATITVGGPGGIVAAVEAFDQAFVAKTDDWYLVRESNPGSFSVDRAEAAGQAPVNSLVVVRAPHAEPDLKNLMGLYYINQAGAWYFSGSKLYHLSRRVPWWDPSGPLPRLDPKNLFKACGAYWPERNRVIWAVPMIVDGSCQENNNRVLVYDLDLRAWLPPFTMELASLTSVRHSSRGAPGGLGIGAIYGGDYEGKVVRLFAPGAQDDAGRPIEAWAQTGWLNLGSPGLIKILRAITVHADSATADLSVSVSSNGNGASSEELHVPELRTSDGSTLTAIQAHTNLRGRCFSFRLSFTGPGGVHGLQVGASAVRDWG